MKKRRLIPEHDAFVRRVAAGECATKVVRDLYPRTRTHKPAAVWRRASRLTVRFRDRINALRARADDKTVATIIERKQILSEIARGNVANFVQVGPDGVRINVGKDNLNSAALQSIKARAESGGTDPAVVTEVRLRDPVAAISELNKMDRVYDAGGGDRKLVIILRDAPPIVAGEAGAAIQPGEPAGELPEHKDGDDG